jgi:hypothetical protein
LNKFPSGKELISVKRDFLDNNSSADGGHELCTRGASLFESDEEHFCQSKRHKNEVNEDL